MPTDPTPQTEQGACTHCGRTKAGHVRYSNFGDVPFCGHPEYGLKVFTEPSPALPAERCNRFQPHAAQPVGTAKPESEKEGEL